MKHAVITGALGFIGQAVCRRMAEHGWSVTGLVRRPPTHPLPAIRYAAFDLDQDIPQETLAAITGADVLIHLAYIAEGSRPVERNVEGAKRLLRAVEVAQIRKRIFISSFSASADAVSSYGKQKFQIEQLFSEKGGVSLRLGFVLGRGGGLFESTLRFLEKSPVVPLVDGGKQPVQVLLVTDLARIIEFVAENQVPSLLSVASRDAFTFRQFYELLAEKLGRKRIFLSVPFFCVYPIAWFAGKIGLRLPINTDNLVGLRRARFRDVSSDLALFPFLLPDAATALKSLEL